MRLPEFTAEQALSFAGAKSEQGVRRQLPARATYAAASGLQPAFARRFGGGLGRRPGGGLAYTCTPDNSACACSGASDCLSCAKDPNACGGKGCICSPTACGCA